MGKQATKGRGGKPNRPKIGRIARVRKDGEDIKFRDWQGEKKVNKYAPVATLFGTPGEGNRGPMISVVFEKGFELNNDEEFYNLYFEAGVSVEFDVDDLMKGGKRGKSRRDDDEEEDESDDEDSDDSAEDPFK